MLVVAGCHGGENTDALRVRIPVVVTADLGIADPVGVSA